MKDKELTEVLKRATVPERGEGYWERFPSQVTAEIERRRQYARTERSADDPVPAMADGSTTWTWAAAFRFLGGRPAIALGVAAVCLTVGFVLGSWKGQRPPGNDPQLAQARKCFQEIEGLFPNQVRAIIFDQQRARLVLAEQADVPTSPPLYVKICGPHGCLSYVTFSGQQIRINGDVFEVLVDRQGGVLLVGREMVWSSATGAAQAGSYRITAKALEVAS